MGKGGGGALAFAGAVLSIAGFPYIGIPLAMIGGIIAQQAMKKEAMARMKAAMTGMRANTRTTERPIPVIYGRHRVGGNVLWMSTEGKGPNDASPPRNKLFVVYGLSEGPIDGYEEMFFNDVKVWDASSGQLRTQFYNAFYSEFRTGTNSQEPFSHVATYHNLYDIASETFPLTAVALVEFFYNSDIYQAIPNVTWTIRGKQVPDWTDASSPGIMKWTQSGPLQVADLLTNKQYGMGIASANLSVSDLTSAHAYATAPISPGSRETIEIVDMSAQRPKYYERTVQIPADTGYTGESVDGGWTPTSLHEFTLSDKIPIKPGSLSFISNLGSAYYDSPRSGMISEFGRILGAGAAQVGSVNYLSGVMAVNRPPVYTDAYEANHNVFDWKGRWYADWEFSYRTKYQNAARSMYVVSTPETLVETGTVTSNIINLYSTQGGAGTFNYGTGALNVYFGAHEWYENQPVEIHYRVSTRARFSTNYPLFEPEKVMDAIKNIQNHYRGFLVYADGQYGVKVDKPEGSVYSFDDDNIVAGTFRLHQPSIKDIPTKITLKYLDALNNYTPAEASFDVRSVDPGQEIEHTLDMPGVTIRDEGMATAYSYANLANLVNYIEFETNHNAIGVEAGDVVDVTHPAAAWTEKLFRVLGISFAKDDKLAISAIEHDPSAYVDDWIQGPMVSRNPSFFPRQSYWPPNVSSATLTEYSRTLSDGTVVPSIKYQIMAVDSANLSVDHWNVYYTNLIRGQQMRLGFSGVNTTGYLSPVEPGWNIVNIHAVSQFGNESAKVWTGSIEVAGDPEHEWQRWRYDNITVDGTHVYSGSVWTSELQYVSSGWYGFYSVQSDNGSMHGAVYKYGPNKKIWEARFQTQTSAALGYYYNVFQGSGGTVGVMWWGSCSGTVTGQCAAIFNASDGSCIRTGTLVRSMDTTDGAWWPIGINNRVILFEYDSSGYMGYRTLSCNLTALGAHTVVDSPETAYMGHCATGANSYVVMTRHGSGSISIWKWNHDMSVNYIANSFIFGPTTGTIAPYGLRVGMGHDGRLVFVNFADIYTGDVKEMSLFSMNVNSIGTIGQWRVGKAGMTVGDWFSPFYSGRPAVSSGYFALDYKNLDIVYPSPSSGTYNNRSQITEWKYYRVDSFVPLNTMTWI